MLKSLMIMTMLLISSIAVSDTNKKDQDKEFEHCVRDAPKCPHDGDFLPDFEKTKQLTEKELQSIRLCRLQRILKCLAPPKEDE